MVAALVGSGFGAHSFDACATTIEIGIPNTVSPYLEMVGLVGMPYTDHRAIFGVWAGLSCATDVFRLLQDLWYPVGDRLKNTKFQRVHRIHRAFCGTIDYYKVSL